MKKFWNWKVKAAAETAPEERTLFLNGTIAEDSWYDDDVTPQLFKDELMSGSGNITVWINSPGGDCVAAAQIYNMLMDYPHDVTVKIDGIAASAASVIAMAGTKVLMSPVSTMMIHNPATVVWGDAGELEKAIAEAPFQTPACPIYQNVDAKPYTDPAQIKANLIAQLTAPVRWTYIVKNMLADGVTEFTELGPGTVLQGLIKKVDANAAVESKSML